MQLDLRCNFDIIAVITKFCTVVLSVIQGIALNTGVLPFQKVGHYIMTLYFYCFICYVFFLERLYFCF
jgi:hypothetical protein